MIHTFQYGAELKSAMTAGNIQATLDIIEKSLQETCEPFNIVDQGLIPIIRKIGNQFEKGEIFLPHLMRSAEAMKKGMSILKPHLKQGISKELSPRTIILGTVSGDIHDIGKNIVSLLLAATGFSVIDLGASIPIARFLEEIKARPDEMIIVGLSSLLTTTMVQQKLFIEALVQEGERTRVKVMVGGACVSAEWAHEIGADGYGLNAQEAVKLATGFSTSL